MIYVTRKKVKVAKEKLSFIGRSYANFDEDHFKQYLAALNWDYMLEWTNPTIMWESLIYKINSYLDEHCPYKTFNIKKKKEPWLNDELLELIIEKDRRYRKAKKSKSDLDWTNAKNFRNFVNNSVKEAKANFIKQQSQLFINDSKKFWKLINNLVFNKNKMNKNIQIEINNELLSQQEVPNVFNNYYINIGNN